MMARVEGRAWSLAPWVAVATGASIPISVASDNVLVALLFLLWLVGRGPRRSWEVLRESRPVQLALGLFALLGLGVLYADVSIAESWEYLWKYRELALIAVLVPVFSDPNVRRRGLIAFCAAVTLSVLVSYLLYLGLVPGGGVFKGTPTDAYVFKLRITHSFLAAFGAFLFAAATFRVRERWQRIVLVSLSLACALNVLVMVQGRTGYIVLAGLAMYGLAERYGSRGVIAAWGLVAALGAGAFFGSSTFHDRTVATFTEAREARAGQATNTSTGLRLEFFRNGVEMIRDRPLTGVGTGGFPKAYAEKIRGTDMVPTRHPHNEYLLLGAQVGLGGPLLLIALFWSLWRAYARLPGAAFERKVGQAMVIAMAIGCLFNAFLLDHTEGLLFAWVSALALGASCKR
jgi:O-antigen ligase